MVWIEPLPPIKEGKEDVEEEEEEVVLLALFKSSVKLPSAVNDVIKGWERSLAKGRALRAPEVEVEVEVEVDVFPEEEEEEVLVLVFVAVLLPEPFVQFPSFWPSKFTFCSSTLSSLFYTLNSYSKLQ